MKKHSIRPVYQPDRHIPVVRTSICTGEQVFGFRDRTTGKVTEIECIHSAEGLDALLYEYGIHPDEVKHIT